MKVFNTLLRNFMLLSNITQNSDDEGYKRITHDNDPLSLLFVYNLVNPVSWGTGLVPNMTVRGMEKPDYFR